MFTETEYFSSGEHRVLSLGPGMSAGVGLGLAVAMVAPLVLVPRHAGLQFLAVLMGFVGAVYFGMGVADGRPAVLLTEFGVAGVFLFAGWAALWADSALGLAVAYAVHGGWDAVHHPRGVPTSVRNWYPPFCAVFDWVVAAFILAWLV